MKPFTFASILFFIIILVGATDAGTSVPASQPTDEKKETTKTEDTLDAVGQVGGIIKLFKEKAWRPAIAAVLTLLVFLWRRFLGSFLISKIPAKHLAWVTAVIGLIATLPAHLTTESFNIWTFLLDGFVTGAEAAILWSMLGKHLLPKIFGEVKNG